MHRFAFPVLALVLVAACSSSSGGGNNATTLCNQNPWQCPAGQTCWPNDQQGDFACLDSGKGQAGAACMDVVGTPACADGLFCAPQTSGSASGICAPYCDETTAGHGCASGEQCEQITVVNTIVHACTSPSSGTDAGTDDAGHADSGGTDAAAGDAAPAGDAAHE
jgi:hypothetical protein